MNDSKRRNFNCSISANTRSKLKNVVWAHNKLRNHMKWRNNITTKDKFSLSPNCEINQDKCCGITSYHTRYSFRNTRSILLMENKIHSNHSVQSLSEVTLRRDVLMANMKDEWSPEENLFNVRKGTWNSVNDRTFQRVSADSLSP